MADPAGVEDVIVVHGLIPDAVVASRLVAQLEAEHQRLRHLVWSQAQEIRRLREENDRLRQDGCPPTQSDGSDDA